MVWSSRLMWPRRLRRGADGSQLRRPELQPLESAVALPVGDRRLEGRELHAGVVGVVLDALLAERLARDVAADEQVPRVAQGPRHARPVRDVGVAGDRRLEIEPGVDAV